MIWPLHHKPNILHDHLIFEIGVFVLESEWKSLSADQHPGPWIEWSITAPNKRHWTKCKLSVPTYWDLLGVCSILWTPCDWLIRFINLFFRIFRHFDLWTWSSLLYVHSHLEFWSWDSFIDKSNLCSRTDFICNIYVYHVIILVWCRLRARLSLSLIHVR